MTTEELEEAERGNADVGIPTVQDRYIQQMLLQVMTPIFDPGFSEHSYGFRPGRSAQDAVRAAQQYVQGGKEWVVDAGERRQERDREGLGTEVSGISTGSQEADWDSAGESGEI